MNNKFGLLITSTLIMFITGCATIVSGDSQVINVQAIDADTHNVIESAKCTITDPKDVAYPVQSNPGSISIPRDYGYLSVTCIAPGYWQKAVGGGSSFNAWTLVDIIFWPSAIVDVATGAAKKYPSHITVLMSTKPVKVSSNKIKAK
jgi:hypothetical protein